MPRIPTFMRSDTLHRRAGRRRIRAVHVRELFDLTGRTALVTGGGRGIGRHVALGLAEAGARVLVAGRKRAALDETVREIERRGGAAAAIEADLADAAQCARLVADAVAATGRLHVLVNNAARVWAAPTLDYPLDGRDRVF